MKKIGPQKGQKGLLNTPGLPGMMTRQPPFGICYVAGPERSYTTKDDERLL